MPVRAARPDPADRGEVLYTAQFLLVLRVLQLLGAGFASLILLGFVAVVVYLLTADPPPALLAMLVALGVVILLSWGALLLMIWRQARMALVVRTAGIEARGFLRDHWIPWERVALVETADHWYWRRATRIVTVDGERIISIVTAYQNLFLRGEGRDPAYRDSRLPQLPTRQAIDAHRRWLSGQRQR